jgi:hypothetical protein
VDNDPRTVGQSNGFIREVDATKPLSFYSTVELRMPFKLNSEGIVNALEESGLFSEREIIHFLQMPEETAVAWICMKLPPDFDENQVDNGAGRTHSGWVISLNRGILLRQLGAPGFTSPPGFIWSPTNETPEF